MSFVQLDDFYCKCDNKEGLGELDLTKKVYICYRCLEIYNIKGGEE